MNGDDLQGQLNAMRDQLSSLQKALEQARKENQLLRQKLDALAKRFFGKKSEQLTPGKGSVNSNAVLTRLVHPVKGRAHGARAAGGISGGDLSRDEPGRLARTDPQGRLGSPAVPGDAWEAFARTDWRVHALCQMPNHFHLVVETPHPNLVAGMQWFLGTYTSRLKAELIAAVPGRSSPWHYGEAVQESA